MHEKNIGNPKMRLGRLIQHHVEFFFFLSVLLLPCYGADLVVSTSPSTTINFPLIAKVAIPLETTQMIVYPENDGTIYSIIGNNSGVTFMKGKKIVKSLSNEWMVSWSKDHKNILTKKIIDESHSTLSVYSYLGIYEWSSNESGGIEYALSPNGEYVICPASQESYPEIPPSFITKEGFINEKISNRDFAMTDKWFLGTQYPLIFTDDSLLAAIGISVSGSTENAQIAIFNRNGEINGLLKTSTLIIHGISFSKDNRYLVTVGPDKNYEFSLMSMWDVQTFLKKWEIQVPFSGYSFSFSKSSPIFIAASDRMGESFLIDLQTGNIKWNCTYKPGQNFIIKSIKFMEDDILLGGIYRSNPENCVFLIQSLNKDVRFETEFILNKTRNDAGLSDFEVLDNKLFIYKQNEVDIYKYLQ